MQAFMHEMGDSLSHLSQTLDKVQQSQLAVEDCVLDCPLEPESTYYDPEQDIIVEEYTTVLGVKDVYTITEHMTVTRQPVYADKELMGTDMSEDDIDPSTLERHINDYALYIDLCKGTTLKKYERYKLCDLFGREDEGIYVLQVIGEVSDDVSARYMVMQSRAPFRSLLYDFVDGETQVDLRADREALCTRITAMLTETGESSSEE